MDQWLIEPGDTLVLELDDIRALKASLVAGQIDVIGHDEPTTRVEVHSVGGKELKITHTGSGLEIDHPQVRWDNFLDVFRTWRTNSARAEVSVAVPRDIALTLGVVSASVLTAGLARPAKLSTVSGDIMVDGCAGHLELNAVGAEVSVRGHDGTITAHTVSGDITLNGSLNRVGVDTVSGAVLIDSATAPATVAANSVSGDITVRVHGDAGFRYTVNSVSGRLHIDGDTLVGMHGRGISGTSGNLHGDWTDLRAHTVSGDVTVLNIADAREASQGAGA